MQLGGFSMPDLALLGTSELISRGTLLTSQEGASDQNLMVMKYFLKVHQSNQIKEVKSND